MLKRLHSCFSSLTPTLILTALKEKGDILISSQMKLSAAKLLIAADLYVRAEEVIDIMKSANYVKYLSIKMNAFKRDIYSELGVCH